MFQNSSVFVVLQTVHLPEDLLQILALVVFQISLQVEMNQNDFVLVVVFEI